MEEDAATRVEPKEVAVAVLQCETCQTRTYSEVAARRPHLIGPCPCGARRNVIEVIHDREELGRR